MQNLKDFHQRTLTIFALIIIACSVNSCTQNQQNAEKENIAVERIGADIALYKFHYRYGAKRMNEVISSAELLLEAMRNPKIQLTDEELELNLHKLTYLWLAATPTTEYVTLINTGEINLIKSKPLLRAFKKMNMDQEKLKQFEEIQVSYVNQELRPFLNSRIDRTTLESPQNTDPSSPTRFNSSFENSSRDLLKNREFANILVDLLFFTKRIILPYDRMKIVMEEMEEIISQEYPYVTIERFGPK